MTRTFDWRELAAGAVAVLVGLAILYESSHYAMGSIAQMGPGLFPAIAGAATCVLGLAYCGSVVLQAAGEREPIRIDWRPLLMISLALAVFGLSLRTLGLALAILLLVAVASLAQPGFRPRLIVGVALFMTAATGLVFVYGLGMSLPLLPGR
jgi:hypothetical protein